MSNLCENRFKILIDILGLPVTVTVVAPVGLPASGKSYLGAEMVDRQFLCSAGVVSTDSIRRVLGGREDWLGDEDLVFDVAYLLVAGRARNGLNAYLDAANLDPQARVRLIQMCGQGSVVFVEMSALVSESEGRRLDRGRNFSDEVMRQLRGWRAELRSPDLPGLWISEAQLRNAMDRV